MSGIDELLGAFAVVHGFRLGAAKTERERCAPLGGREEIVPADSFLCQKTHFDINTLVGPKILRTRSWPTRSWQFCRSMFAFVTNAQHVIS